MNKRLFTTLLSLVILSLTLSNLMGQEATQQTKREIRIKTTKVENGVKVELDTTIVLKPGEDPATIMQSLGLEDVSVEMDQPGTRRQMTVVKEKKSKEGETVKKKEVEVTVEVEAGEGGEHKIIIDKDGDRKVLQMDGGTWTTDDGKEIDLDDMDGEIHIHIEKDGAEGEGAADRNVFKFKTDDGEGKVIILDKEKLHTEDVQVFVEKEGDSEEVKTVKTIRISIKMEEPSEADYQMLQKSGAEKDELSSGLQVDQLRFYPNPSEGKFKLSFHSDVKGSLEIQIRDLQGKKVFQEYQAEFSGAYERKLDLSAESSGIYFLTLTHQGQSLTKKVVIE